MGGVNPYIDKPEVEKATQKFSVTFVNEETGERKTFEVDPAKIPYDHTGLEGSILDIAFGAGVQINHSCGGVCACSTCHVIVAEGLNNCSEATDDEMDMLDNAPGLTPESRLSCQCVPDGRKPLVVIVPAWNKNYVKEGH
jgi:ferredoxin, 2Fe-2S